MATKNRATRSKRRTTKKKRPIHKRVLIHPIFIFFWMCVGVLLVAWTLKAGAADVHVTARVDGPPPTDPAVITEPANGTHFSTIPIQVSGTCPDSTYVEIFVNSIMSGSALCTVSNTFNLQVNLFAGNNQLVAHVFNYADDEGPVSDPVNVVYTPPLPPPAGSPSSGGGSGFRNTGSSAQPSASPFYISTDFTAKGVRVGDTVIWTLEIGGGSAPYAVSVDWGDGTAKTLVSRAASGKFDVSHKYTKDSTKIGQFIVKVTATDATGQSAYLQFFTIVSKRVGLIGNIQTNFGAPGQTNWIWTAWPFYITVVLMILSFWLGEHQILMLPRNHRFRHR